MTMMNTQAISLKMLFPLALSFLGFTIRWVISFGVCVWLYVFISILYLFLLNAALSGARSFGDVLSIFFLAYAVATGEAMGLDGFELLSLSTLATLAVIAFAIAFAWGKVCRRLCGPAKDWF